MSNKVRVKCFQECRPCNDSEVAVFWSNIASLPPTNVAGIYKGVVKLPLVKIAQFWFNYSNATGVFCRRY